MLFEGYIKCKFCKVCHWKTSYRHMSTLVLSDHHIVELFQNFVFATENFETDGRNIRCMRMKKK
jgi:hypothetical protein